MADGGSAIDDLVHTPEAAAARPVGRVEAERDGGAEAEPLPRHRQGDLGEPAQPAVGVAHPDEGRVRRVRARRRGLPRLDDQRRPPLHDAPRTAEGEHRDARSPTTRSPTSKPSTRSTGGELRELGRLAHPMVRQPRRSRLPARRVGRRARSRRRPDPRAPGRTASASTSPRAASRTRCTTRRRRRRGSSARTTSTTRHACVTRRRRTR